MQYILFLVIAIIIVAIFVKLSGYDPRYISWLKKPKYNSKIHVFSADAVSQGREAYENAIDRNKNHVNKNIVQKYASLVEEGVKSVVMYRATTNIEDEKEMKKQAYYWAAWGNEYMKRIDDIVENNNLIVSDEAVDSSV